MHRKFEAFEKFIEFRHEVEKQTKKFIKVLRLDREGEYLSKKFQTYLKDNGVVSQWHLQGHLISIGYLKEGIGCY